MKHLREKEREVGKDVTLKDGREEEDIPEREDRRRMDSEYGRLRYRVLHSIYLSALRICHLSLYQHIVNKNNVYLVYKSV